ncbi:amidohydrolase [Utexia brackfieldae]|uniref:amidohydrolase n=1 Tax=Utexia brackfieldae TaxID=3074108 RepID=UPI00370DE275
MNHHHAETVFINGYIFTADKHNQVCEAIAIADGYIIASGTNQEIKKYINENTQVNDLAGKTMMPGIIDSHLHPFWGGLQLSGCHLNYESLTIAQTLSRIQKHLDQDSFTDENDWLQVRAWLRQGMLPSGTDITRADLDTLSTRRPVILFSNDCHTLVANSRALTLFGLDENTPSPSDGKIGRNDDGSLNGILEDAPAMRAFDSIPGINDAQAQVIAKNVQTILNRQGVTTVMDARALPIQFDAFSQLKLQNQLTLRVFGAREITPDDASTLASVSAAVSRMAAFAEKYTDKQLSPKPGIAIKHTKFFVDGVLHKPIMTASLLSPYLDNQGNAAEPCYVESDRYGDLYYPNDILEHLVLEVSQAGFHPHMHTVAEGAIEVCLNAVEKMRQQLPNKDIRPAFVHNELAAPHQYQRFAQLNVIASLSFQWAGMPQALMDDDKSIIGETRFAELEPIAKFLDAGARIAFGSDWPIDPLNEWYDFKVAMTRKISQANAPRLDTDRNLTAIETLRAATIDAAYAIGYEDQLGSIEVGKFADLIILDRNPFQIAAEDIEQVNVLSTIVGGVPVI